MIFTLKNTGYENEKLSNVADITVPPELCFYKLKKNESVIWYQNNQIKVGNGDFVIVRRLDNPRAVFAKIAAGQGAVLDRPSDSVSTTGIPKISSEITKFFTHKNSAVSYIAFSQGVLNNYLHLLEYPLVYKPANGSHGQGIELVENAHKLNQVVQNHNFSLPILLQEYLNKRFEYRVITWNKNIINFVRKVGVQKKDFKGRKFEARPSLKQDYIDYIQEFAGNGLLGIDIVRTEDDKIYIIEANRAPEFEGVDRATGKDTARLLIEAMRNGQ